MNQAQLVLPLLDVLSTADKPMRTKDVYDAVANHAGTPAEERRRTILDGRYNGFERDVRWAKQIAAAQGLVQTPERGMWALTPKGQDGLRTAKPGVVVTIYVNEMGAALWGSCEDAFKMLEPGSVQALISSPPYPLLRKKEYGNLDAASYVDWLTDLAASWKPLLSSDGSLVLNLGECWEPGRPTQSLYAERLLIRLVDDLGFKVCQKFEWFNPSKMPAPAEWVTVRRVRVKPALEKFLWLSLSDHPYADNRNVLAPYSASMKSLIARGGEKSANRPSGHVIGAGSFGADRGGAIPSNLLVAANTASRSPYQDACKAHGLPVHPARFPSVLPEFFIKLLTKPGDLVTDPFGGSFKTAAAAYKLGRRFFSCEQSLDYALGGRFRFT